MNQKKLFRLPLHIDMGRRQFLGWMAALGASVGTGTALWLKGQGSVLVAHDAMSNTIVSGEARFTVLTPTLIRMEFANDGQFDNGTTFNVVNRSLPAPRYTTQITSGWLQIQTANLLLQYQVGSGAFNADNLKVHLMVSGQNIIASPFESFAYNTLCEAEQGHLSGDASIAMDHLGYTGSGFVVYTSQGATATWSVTSVPGAGNATLHIKYANATGGDGQDTTRTLSLYVNGTKADQLSFPTTTDWDTWAEIEQTVTLKQGTNTISLAYDVGDSGNINVDSFSVTPVGSSAAVSTNLGGWRRSVDGLAERQPMFDGLLDRRGWYVLDDSTTALFDTSSNALQKRSGHNGQYQDGYFFGYGHDYQTGLGDFAKITGAALLLPRWAFGIWSSRYYPYAASDLQTIVGQYRNNHIPLDFLMIDTDFKSPNSWDGWEWNATYFPDPQGFMKWTQSQHLNIGLNIHPAIAGNDPQFAQANTTAGSLISWNGEYVWDWSNAAHVSSYFALHQPFDRQGVRVWWLDYCCDDSRTSFPGVTTDTWINSLYAQHTNALGKRGFAFSRTGSGYSGGVGQSGIWAEHRYTAHFTGDANPTWDMLQWETEFTTQEGNVGIPYVSHDLGSFHGGTLDDDMYIRWIQFGTFQPIFRIHSDHGYRYPWDYPNVQAQAEQFFRLREALIPFTYSLAYQATTTGLPITRGMYLYYPQNDEAYTYRNQYFMGDSMLVAPVITSGTNAVASVWFPSGTWTNFFSGRVYVGPSVESVAAYYDTMPVFVKSGGIIPLQPYMNYVGEHAVDPLTLKVYTGQNGSFTLYEDEGDNHNYKNGNFAQTSISYDEASNTLTIAAMRGSYSGALTSRGYAINFANIVSIPVDVTVNGQKLNAVGPGSGEGWWYNSALHTLSLQLNSRATSETITVKFSVGGTVIQAENATLVGGASSNTNHTGFSGKSFVDGLRSEGASATFTLQATQARNYAVILRYANGHSITQTLSLYVNGTRVRRIILPGTADWNIWANAVEYVALSAGKNIITYKYDVGDSGNVNLDRVSIAYINAVRSGSTYKIINTKTGKVLAVSEAGTADGTNVQISTDNSTGAQQWTITDRGQGIYKLINTNSGKVLGVSQAATADGTNVQIYTDNGTDAQGWYITDVNGSICLGNIGSGSSLNVSDDGTNIDIWSYNGKGAQQWQLTKI